MNGLRRRDGYPSLRGFPQSNARSTCILLDELDPRRGKSAQDFRSRLGAPPKDVV